MSIVMEEDIKRWTAKRKTALVLEIIQGKTTVAEAKAEGAIGLFESKYGEKVRMYTMGPFSKEICGGPHVAHTSELGRFRIVKEGAASAGVRRIRAVLEDGDAPDLCPKPVATLE